MKKITVLKAIESLPHIDFLMCPYCGKKYQIPNDTNKENFCCNETSKEYMKEIRMYYGIEYLKRELGLEAVSLNDAEGEK